MSNSTITQSNVSAQNINVSNTATINILNATTLTATNFTISNVPYANSWSTLAGTSVTYSPSEAIVTCPTATTPVLNLFTSNASNMALTYTGTQTLLFKIHATLTIITPNATTRTVTVFFGKNNLRVNGAQARMSFSTANDTRSCTVSDIISLSTNDVVALRHTSTNAFTGTSWLSYVISPL